MIFYVSNNILTRLSLLLLLLLSTTITITTIITTFAPVYQPKINTLVVTSVVHRYVYWKEIFNMKINIKRLVSFFSSIWWVNYFEKKKKNLRKTKKKKKKFTSKSSSKRDAMDSRMRVLWVWKNVDYIGIRKMLTEKNYTTHVVIITYDI